jgi:hypothetical protein
VVTNAGVGIVGRLLPSLNVGLYVMSVDNPTSNFCFDYHT